MKLNRDLWQPSKNCHADRKGRPNGKKKRGRSSGLCHAWTLNIDRLTSFFFSSCIQTRGNLWGKGTQQSKQKVGQQKGRNKCKRNRSKLTIWAEVIYQNDLLDEIGRGAVQNTAGTQERKSHFVSCHNNDNVRTDRNLLCYALQQEYQTPVKWKWWPCPCNSVHWQESNCKWEYPRELWHLSQTLQGPTARSWLWDLPGAASKGCCSELSASKQRRNGEHHLPRGSPVAIPICQALGKTYHCWRA